MNGIHDMGGMHGMGPIQRDKNEPVFHERWEARTFALVRATAALGDSNTDMRRHQIEQIPAADYLRMSYYERWFAGLQARLLKAGVVTPEEVETGKAAPGSTKQTPVVTADMVPAAAVNSNIPSSHDPKIRPRFKRGERVRARNINPTGHTRLPRYARGKIGEIDRDHGVHTFPDTNAHGLGEKRQHVYSVRFAARELWGKQTPARNYVYIDLWDDYLERV